MNNAHAPGRTLPYINGSGSTISSGEVVEIVSGITGFCGIAAADILDTETGDLALEGVFSLAAETAAGGFVNGALLYWDGTKLTDTASTNTRIGRAWGLKAAGTAVAYVKLHGS